jgi:outer membrane receptor protein involved in Fe transport
VTGEYVDIDENGFANFSGVVKGAQLAAPPLAPENRRNVLRDDSGGTDQNSARINGKLEVETGAGSLVALAGWRRVTVRQPDSDFDGSAYSASASDPSSALTSPAPQVYTLDDRDTSRQAELRFLTPDSGGLLQAVFGATYFEETLRYSDATMPVRNFALALAAFGLDGSWQHRADLETRSWAGYGELVWTPVATIEVTADLRYTRDRKDIDSAQTATGLYSSIVGLPNISLDTSNTFDNWSPGITLAYKPDDTLTLFAKYVRGFRAGGFNTLAYDPALLPYESEEAENYEFGGKTLLFDRRVELGASLFYLRIDNALVPQQDPGIQQDLWPLQNGGVAETTGLEVDLSAGVATGLTLAASAGAYQYDLTGFSILDRRPFAPDYTASLVADYQRPLTPAITGVARLGFRHRSGGRLPFGYGIDMDDYNLLDAQFGVRLGHMELAAFVRNALDDHYKIGNYSVGVVQARFVSASGLDPNTTRSILRDPGSVFGVRLTVTL